MFVYDIAGHVIGETSGKAADHPITAAPAERANRTPISDALGWIWSGATTLLSLHEVYQAPTLDEQMQAFVPVAMDRGTMVEKALDTAGGIVLGRDCLVGCDADLARVAACGRCRPGQPERRDRHAGAQ